VTQPPLPARPPRVFAADDILSGRVNLHGYPFRYIVVRPSGTTGLATALAGGEVALVDLVLSAAELLESQGWELFSIDHSASVACLRRLT
jgi:hypothetical protein